MRVAKKNYSPMNRSSARKWSFINEYWVDKSLRESKSFQNNEVSGEWAKSMDPSKNTRRMNPKDQK